MNLAPEPRQDFEALPAALRQLLAAELAAGNSIVEVAHRFPAPPAGAYFKLANKVSTRSRASGEGIVFYERTSSLYSGEFTDTERFYFILEPPNPPPPEPDMDLIRRQALGPQDALTQMEPLQRRSGAPAPEPARLSPRALVSTETATGANYLLHFRDHRPPHEIKCALEQDLMTLLAPSMDNGRLVMATTAQVVGAAYVFELRFEAAMPLQNCYSLRVVTSWAGQAATHHDYYRKTSESWFRFWTRNFKPANPPRADGGSAKRYQKLCEACLTAENQLDTVPAIQRTIVAAMKRGARFTTSHKEGGTNISWNGERFVRSDYGEDPATLAFSSESEFLTALRKFYDWETSKSSYPDKASDSVAWKLILRLLRTN